MKLDIATIFNEKQIKIPQKGVLSEPIVTDGDGTHCLNYKLMVDKDPVHNTFRPIIQGGALGPAFDGSMSIVRCVNTGSKEGEGPTTPAVRSCCIAVLRIRERSMRKGKFLFVLTTLVVFVGRSLPTRRCLKCKD